MFILPDFYLVIASLNIVSCIYNTETILYHDKDFISKLDKLSINKQKQSEILKNDKITKILQTLFSTFDPHKLHYTLASKIPNNINNEENILLIGKLIDEQTITHEKALNCAFDYLSSNKDINQIKPYILSFNKSDNEITHILTEYTGTKNKKELCKYAMNHSDLKYTSGLQINKNVDLFLVNNKEEHIETNKNSDNSFAWLKEGELSKIHMPETNTLNTPEILHKHLERTNKKVITRFPPEPNGILHIGHAKALNLSYEFALMHKGDFILRFDDTNPKAEKEEYVKRIIEDITWLFGKDVKDIFTNQTHASDYFDKFIELAFDLIKKNKAFVCNQTQDEMKKSREMNEDSPYRNRSVETNIALFQEMIDGKWKEGSISLRLKMDMKNKNPLMHDLVAYRVVEHEHYRTKNKYKVYPSYDFTHCINDSLEDITHSFCSREFYNRKDSYYWLLNELDLYKPVQWEFSRLNLTDAFLSKRKIKNLIENGDVKGWDDPRLFTLSALRRRGFVPSAINEFVKSLGVTFNPATIEMESLENCVRDSLMKIAKKINCVIEPLRVIIKMKNGTEEIIYIERSDFSKQSDTDFLRLTPEQPVGLFQFITIKYTGENDTNIFAEETDLKPKKYIHFVKDYVKIELRMYDKLFINDEFNNNSLVIKEGYCEKEILDYKVYDHLQFRRVGFFCVDKDTTKERVVVNLTLPLKNSTWK